MSLWQGRLDGDDPARRRWHQVVQPFARPGDARQADVVLGFACDEGVRRNQGRVGAVEGPDAIRRALANLPRPGNAALYDAGNVHCDGDGLQQAQQDLADKVAEIFECGGRPLVLGGGHEVAWGSFLGLARAVPDEGQTLGIINLDAHFDLRDPSAGASSGTPFRQVAEWCDEHGQPFHYLVLGINPFANTPELFDYARAKGVRWIEDVDCTAGNMGEIGEALDAFLAPLDYLYLTICLDAFPAAVAPGVSAPGVPGMCPSTSIALLRRIREACARLDTQLALLDVAEMNPRYDRDGITARWAARIIGEVVS